MPYIDYDEDGNITGKYANQQYENQAFVTILDETKIYKYINNELVEDNETKIKKAKKDILDKYKEILNEFDLSYCSLCCQGYIESEEYITDRDNIINELVTELSEV